MFTIMQGGVHSTREIMRSYAGIIRIRFIGYDLSPAQCRTPLQSVFDVQPSKTAASIFFQSVLPHKV